MSGKQIHTKGRDLIMAREKLENAAAPQKKGRLLRNLIRIAAVYALADTAVKIYAEHRKKRMAVLEKENKDSAYKSYDLFMGGREIKIEKEKFSGANVKSCMSGLSLNLQEIQMDSDVFLKISNTLGGIEIKVPYGVNVKCDSKCILGGVACAVPEYEGEDVHTVYIEAKITLGGMFVQAAKNPDETVEDMFEESVLGNLPEEMKKKESAAKSAETAE